VVAHPLGLDNWRMEKQCPAGGPATMIHFVPPDVKTPDPYPYKKTTRSCAPTPAPFTRSSPRGPVP